MREAFAVTEVLDSAGDECKLSDVRLRLQTLGFEDSYWLETGHSRRALTLLRTKWRWIELRLRRD